MSNLILPTVSNLPVSPAGGDELTFFTLVIMAGVYIGAFVPILWRQFRAGKAV